MLVYYLVCLTISFLSLEHFVVMRVKSSEQRLLPLVLGLGCLYLFYDIVEYITSATDVFKLLKDLLLLEMMYLLFYYILDFTQVVLPMFMNLIMFIFIGIANVIVCLQMNNNAVYRPIVLGIVGVFAGLDIYTAIRACYIRSRHRRIKLLYKALFAGLAIPSAAVLLSEFTAIDDNLILPGAIAAFCAIVTWLIMRGEFYDSEQFLEENLFHDFDGSILLFDSDFYYIDCSNKAKEQFSFLLKEMEKNRLKYKFADALRKWSENPGEIKLFDYKDKSFRLELQEIKRNDDLKGYLLYVYDITSEVQQIKNAKQETKLKSDFLASMSHELRSPLNAIIGGSDIVIKRGDLSESSRLMVSHIGEAGKSLLTIVNSILDYSKLEAGRLELKNTEYDLKDLLEQLSYNTVVNLKGKNVKYEMVCDTRIPKVMVGDVSRVNMILNNILSNAVKYTKEGSIQCKVSVEALDSGAYKVIYSVKDTGIGMSEEQIKNAFDKYVSYADVKIAETTGIGLYTVKELCSMMKGDVSVESKENVGSTFTASFEQHSNCEYAYEPFEVDESILAMDKAFHWETVEPTYIYPDAKVLVVDDMKVNREVFIGKSMPWGFKTAEADNGTDAIEMAKSSDFDLIIMDQMMPGLSGIETATEIKKFSNTPIVMLTANTSDEMKAETAESGLDGFLSKPILIENLKDCLERFLPVSKRKDVLADTEAYQKEILKQDANYIYILEAYVEDIDDIWPKLWDYLKTDLDMFRVKVHGIKGTSRQIGRYSMGDSAEVMEMAAKANHTQFIEKHLDGFIEDLKIISQEAHTEIDNMRAK